MCLFVAFTFALAFAFAFAFSLAFTVAIGWRFLGKKSGCRQRQYRDCATAYQALSPSDRDARIRAYAKAVATDIAARVDALAAAWADTEGSFRREFERSGPGGTVFPSTQAALNAVSDAVFYVEGSVKEDKVARPLGLTDCATATCPELMETRHARIAKENLSVNVRGC